MKRVRFRWSRWIGSTGNLYFIEVSPIYPLNLPGQGGPRAPGPRTFILASFSRHRLTLRCTCTSSSTRVQHPVPTRRPARGVFLLDAPFARRDFFPGSNGKHGEPSPALADTTFAGHLSVRFRDERPSGRASPACRDH